MEEPEEPQGSPVGQSEEAIVYYSPPAQRDLSLRRLSASIWARVEPAIRRLATHPRPAGVKVLKGHEETFFRISVAEDWRVIYAILQGYTDRLVLEGRPHTAIMVVQVGHRRDVYRSFGRRA